MSSVSMEDLSKIEEEFLQSDEEAKKDPKTDKLQVSEKSEEKPQLENVTGTTRASNGVLPDKKNDEKSEKSADGQNPPASSSAKVEPTVKTELMDMNTLSTKDAVATAEAGSAAPSDNDVNMDPIVLGTYTEKDLTVKDPTETEANTKDLFKGTIQLLRQILGMISIFYIKKMVKYYFRNLIKISIIFPTRMLQVCKQK